MTFQSAAALVPSTEIMPKGHGASVLPLPPSPRPCFLRDPARPAFSPRPLGNRTRRSLDECERNPASWVRLRGQNPGFGDRFYIDEVFVRIRAKQYYRWRAVDKGGDVVDVLLQGRRDARAAKRIFRRLIWRQGDGPWKIVTEKLGSYRVAHQELVPDSIHLTDRYANNRAEQSHQTTRMRERGMRQFKSAIQIQRFLNLHGAVYNLFNLGRLLVGAIHYRNLRQRAFASWNRARAF